MLQLVPAECQPDDSDFLWPTDLDPASWRIVRCPRDGVGRPLDEASLIEIDSAMAVVAEQSGGIEPEELKREALGLFGTRRMATAIGARLDAAPGRAVSRGLLVSPDGLVRSRLGDG